MPAPNELPEAMLLPCPFCGGRATRGVSRMAEWSTPTYWTGCEPCNLAFIGKAVNTRETADAAWNRRAVGDGREALKIAEDRRLTLVIAMRRAGFDIRTAQDWTPSELAAIDTAMGAGQEGCDGLG